MLTIRDLEHVFTHVDWEELRDQNIFITGGTGWFGKWMVETLIYANDRLKLKLSRCCSYPFKIVINRPLCFILAW